MSLKNSWYLQILHTQSHAFRAPRQATTAPGIRSQHSAPLHGLDQERANVLASRTWLTHVVLAGRHERHMASARHHSSEHTTGGPTCKKPANTSFVSFSFFTSAMAEWKFLQYCT